MEKKDKEIIESDYDIKLPCAYCCQILSLDPSNSNLKKSKAGEESDSEDEDWGFGAPKRQLLLFSFHLLKVISLFNFYNS